MTDNDTAEHEHSKGNGKPKKKMRVWPNAAPVENEFYGYIDPMWKVQMVAMTQDTWNELQKQFRVMRERIEHLSRENIEMKQGRSVEGPRIILPR